MPFMHHSSSSAGIGVVSLFVLSLGLLALAGCPNFLGMHKTAAEENAAKWAKEVGLPLEHPVCNARDTDGDGYVSCSFKVGDDVRTYECNGWTLFMPSEGCREPKIKIPAR